MLKIGDKTFLNLQEAVAWLMENNCIPFQCTAPYAANTEIGMGTLVNPSPAKVRIGSIIFFSDSKVSTVTGITQNGFIVSDQYNDLVDDVVYVSNVVVAADGHLVVTLSNGNAIDAGLIKQVLSFSIDAYQHLIANYNDGTSTDLGAIFSGNVNISGNLNVAGGISGSAITGDSIIENMSGYTMTKVTTLDWEAVYGGIVKNGNKITLVLFGKYTFHTGDSSDPIVSVTIPNSVGVKLIPYTLGAVTNMLDERKVAFYDGVASAKMVDVDVLKQTDYFIQISLRYQSSAGLVDGTTYVFRHEVTFLLSNSLI